MTNYENMKTMSIERMAREIKAIANWDRKQKRKAEKDPDFYVKYLSSNFDVQCKSMGDSYCANECPLKCWADKEATNGN